MLRPDDPSDVYRRPQDPKAAHTARSERSCEASSPRPRSASTKCGTHQKNGSGNAITMTASSETTGECSEHDTTCSYIRFAGKTLGSVDDPPLPHGPLV